MATEKKNPTAKTTDAADSPQTDDPKYHAPSQPDQASEADKDAADNLAVIGGDDAYADNEIEATVRRMAAAGATSGEIAAYRADALAKLGQ